MSRGSGPHRNPRSPSSDMFGMNAWIGDLHLSPRKAKTACACEMTHAPMQLVGTVSGASARSNTDCCHRMAPKQWRVARRPRTRRTLHPRKASKVPGLEEPSHSGSSQWTCMRAYDRSWRPRMRTPDLLHLWDRGFSWHKAEREAWAAPDKTQETR